MSLCAANTPILPSSAYHTGNLDDLYDSNMKLWKVALLAVPDAAKVLGVSGGVAPGLDGFFTLWDIQNDHLTVITASTKRRRLLVNSDAPNKYQDMERYASPAAC